MVDLIRHSAANLLAISLALAADKGDAPEDMAASTDHPTALTDPTSVPLDQAALELAQK